MKQLDKPYDIYEHVHRFARVFERHIGRRGDDDGAGHRGVLDERKLHIAGSGRKIDHQIIEIAPVDAAQKLLDHAVKHGTAPYQRFVAGAEEAHRHQLDAIILQRLDSFADGRRWLIAAHHQRHVGAVDVRVEQADFAAHPGQCDGEVHGDRSLADPSFAASHGDQIPHAGDRKLRLYLLVGAH